MTRNDPGRELYCTPRHVTQALLVRERFPGTIWEPAAGKGHIVRVLHEHGYADVVASDLHDWGCGYDTVDFLISERISDSLVTNPPYSLTHKFLTHAKRVVRCKVAMLLPVLHEFTESWLAAHEYDLVFPLRAVYTFANAMRWANTQQTWGRMKYAWFVFERGAPPQVVREKIVFHRWADGAFEEVSRSRQPEYEIPQKTSSPTTERHSVRRKQ